MRCDARVLALQRADVSMVRSVREPSFDQVFRENGPYVWRLLRYLGVRAADLDDACQEVFLVVHRKLGAFEGRSSLRTWLYSICLRVAHNRRRPAAARREVFVGEAPEVPALETPADSLERAQSVGVLLTILETLDDDKRAVFILHEIEQLPIPEVADLLGCPVQTAYYRLHAARAQVNAAAARYRARQRVV